MADLQGILGDKLEVTGNTASQLRLITAFDVNQYVPKRAVASALPLRDRLDVLRDCLLTILNFGLDANIAEEVEPIPD